MTKGDNMRYLKIRLAAPMMYFAKHNMTSMNGNWSDTESVPTKRAIVGLIGGAMGIPRNSPMLSEWFETLDVKYAVIRPGYVMQDFQTVRPQAGQRFQTVEGKEKAASFGMIKYVWYVTDAEFWVYVGADESKLQEIYDALSCPVYAPYIGKRTCVPWGQLFEDEFRVYAPEEITESLKTYWKNCQEADENIEEDKLNVYDCI